MSYEQSLAHKAIYANKFLGAHLGQDADLGTTDNLLYGLDIQLVKPIRATALTVSPTTLFITDSPSDYVPTTRPSSYSVELRAGLVVMVEIKSASTLTNRKYEEKLGSVSFSAFDELQKIRADDTRFRGALRELLTLTNIHEIEAIAKRLEILLEDFQGDYGRCLSTESLRSLIALLSLHPMLRRPMITASENGNLSVEWKSEDGRQFLGLQMLPMRQIRFFTFRPDAKFSTLRKHLSGLTSVDELFSDLASYDILSWICVD